MNKSLSNILSYQNRSQYHIDSTISFTGKERDEETGYSYFGARYYDADLLTGWMSVDPMGDKYPSISPYAYCTWNPIKLVDPNGEEVNPIYDENGNWICNTKEGFTGDVLIYKGNLALQESNIESLSNMSATDVLQMEDITKLDYWWDALTSEALSRITTNVIIKSLQKNNGSIDFLENTPPFTLGQLYGQRLYCKKESRFCNWTTNLLTGEICGYGFLDYEYNIENILCAVIVHEWYGHAQKKWSDESMNHSRCYEAVVNSLLWEPTTDLFKTRNQEKYNKYLADEYIGPPQYEPIQVK